MFLVVSIFYLFVVSQNFRNVQNFFVSMFSSMFCFNVLFFCFFFSTCFPIFEALKPEFALINFVSSLFSHDCLLRCSLLAEFSVLYLFKVINCFDFSFLIALFFFSKSFLLFFRSLSMPFAFLVLLFVHLLPGSWISYTLGAKCRILCLMIAYLLMHVLLDRLLGT